MVLWIDIETTGLNPRKHSIIQIGAIITRRADGKILAKFDDVCDILKGDEIDDYAMKVNRIEPKQLKHRQTGQELLDNFIEWLRDNNHSGGKYLCAGYNVRFDIDFLIQWAARASKHDMHLQIHRNGIDVMNLVIIQEALGKIDKLPNHRLTTVCRELNVKLKGHDAYDDIKATRKLFRKLVKGKI